MNYSTNNVIVGNGEVPAKHTYQGIVWVLPGGQVTKDRAVAETVARNLDALITSNMGKYNRKLFK